MSWLRRNRIILLVIAIPLVISIIVGVLYATGIIGGFGFFLIIPFIFPFTFFSRGSKGKSGKPPGGGD